MLVVPWVLPPGAVEDDTAWGVIPLAAACRRLEETDSVAAVIVDPLVGVKNGAFNVSWVLVPVTVGLLTSLASADATWSSEALIVPIVPACVAATGVE